MTGRAGRAAFGLALAPAVLLGCARGAGEAPPGGTSVPGPAPASAAFRAAEPAYAWSFPRDHWAHSGYRTEWWYLTGRLEAADDPGARFGYQLTFFRIGVLAEAPAVASAWATDHLVMAHVAVTDLATGRHVFSEVVRRGVPLLGGFGDHPDPVIAWCTAPAGTEGRWTLRWNGEAFDVEVSDAAQRIAFRLSTRPGKPLVFHGPNGYSRKGEGEGAASQYYSFTRLVTSGTLDAGSGARAVRGTSWMDKEMGSNVLGAEQGGWDWLSLALDDGRELMLYVLRKRSSSAGDFARGTLVAADGSARALAAAEFRMEPRGVWKSPATGAPYPAGFHVSVPSAGIDLEVRPLLADEENRSRLVDRLFYWEGMVDATARDGARAGSGYLELTGYGTDSRPAL